MSPRLILSTALALGLAVAPAFPAMTQAEEIDWRECRPYERRITCVVDGDTLWYLGTKIRMLGIDAPEVEGWCKNERRLAQAATLELTRLLNTGLIRIAYDGQDRYGRHLARLWVRQGEVGPAMIAAGLAVPFGRRGPSPWCR
ncbi:thermonuclease family protein [Roseovarius dicentrarchi]|uniref:thermonuclease family protein n=1 Tax=Roseovarius dicentrarchi TaxID=2250573 RepID=UPI0019393A22|nr:thermonuclease family protein [Roseovarius dicentrarchi]